MKVKFTMPESNRLKSEFNIDNTKTIALKSELNAEIEARIEGDNNLQSEIARVENEIPDVSNFATKNELEQVENKIPDISGLATKTELEAVEDEIPDISNLATKNELQEVEESIPIVNNGTLTIIQNGETKGVFRANDSNNITVNLETGDGGVVNSVNGQTGDVVLTASDVGALSNTTVIPIVNNSTITFTQGGATKGTITLNQSSNQTIALDAGGGGGSSDTYTKAEIDALLAQKQDVLILNNPFSFTLDQSRGRIAGFTESDGVLTPQGIATAPTFDYADNNNPLHAYYTVGNAVNNLGSTYILMPFYNHHIYRLPKGRSGWLSGGYFEGSVFVPVVVFYAGLPDNFTSGTTSKWNNLWYFGGTYTTSGNIVSNGSSSIMFNNEAAVAEDTTSDFSSLVKSFNFQIDIYDNTRYDTALQYWSYLNDSEWVGSTTVTGYNSSRHSQLERMTHILYIPSINDSFSKDVLAIYAQTERMSWGVDDFIEFMSDNPTNIYDPSTDESVALTIKLDPSALTIDANGRLTLIN